MAYMHHIDNLYKPEAQDILLFKECWALEKVDGTGAKITLKFDDATKEPVSQYYSGGASHESFIKLFDDNKIKTVFKELSFSPETIFEVYGEAAGGKIQGMSHTYGPHLFFIGYDICINKKWLSVPDAERIMLKLGLEFVPYIKTTTDISSLDKAKMAFSQLAVRKGMGAERIMEGVILRPLIELTKNNGSRIISKHKRDEFRETASPRPVVDPEKIKALESAEVAATEYVTLMRLNHILPKIENPTVEKTGEIIKLMIADISREGSHEITINDALLKAISRKTALLFKEYLKSNLYK